MFLAAERVSKFTVVQFGDTIGTMEGAAFLRHVVATFPYAILRSARCQQIMASPSLIFTRIATDFPRSTLSLAATCSTESAASMESHTS
jgi:hypothetical protein